MAHVLIVEDSREQAKLIAAVLDASGFTTEVAGDGVQALAALARREPDLVLTDLIMPQMNGLELVQEVSRKHPLIPVILMTAYGSGEIAMQALRRGASSYVSKSRIADEIAETVNNTIAVAQARREQERVLHHLRETAFHFVLENDQSLVYPLIAYLKDAVGVRVRDGEEKLLMQVSVALHEALVNAMHHGNLEVGSELRRENLQAYLDLVEQRRTLEPYSDRRVDFRAHISRSGLRCVIRDDGPGFDPRAVPDPTDPLNLEKPSGRGLYLILTFMDQVSHNDAGNQITMFKRFPTQDSEEP